jgi:hypothetical protein
MNVFYLHSNPIIAANLQCDQHVIKMSTEYMQMLCTAHRVLDGQQYYDKTAAGRRIARWKLPDDREQTLYKACHVNHPCNVWLRESTANYNWLYQLWKYTAKAYSARYNKIHATEFVAQAGDLKQPPHNIPKGPFTEPPRAMPDQYKVNNVIESYHNFYRAEKSRFATWKNETPGFMRVVTA